MNNRKYHQTRGDRRDESRGMRRGAERRQKQSLRARRHESEGMRGRKNPGYSHMQGPHERHAPRERRHNPYYQNAEDIRHESEGMGESWEDMHRERSHHHRGPRDDQQSSTQMYHMGKEYYGPGYGEPANLPQRSRQHYYPHTYSNLEGDYPDTLREIDEDAHNAYEKVAHYPSDSMY